MSELQPPTPIEPWSVVDSRYALRDRWLTVRADDCVTRDRVSIAPFYVLEYPDWVVVVAIDTDDQLIMVEQYRHGLGVVSLELPAGGVEPTDACALDAGARELAEETGSVAQSLKLIASLSPNPASHNNRVHIVLAEGVRRVTPAAQDPTEKINVIARPVASAAAMALAGEMVQAIHVAALALALGSIGRW